MSLVADLLDLWNATFFLDRNVELVLYKGRERHTGRGAGLPEVRLPPIDMDEDSSATPESEDSLGDQQRWRTTRSREERLRLAREQSRKLLKKCVLYMTYVPPLDFALA